MVKNTRSAQARLCSQRALACTHHVGQLFVPVQVLGPDLGDVAPVQGLGGTNTDAHSGAVSWWSPWWGYAQGARHAPRRSGTACLRGRQGQQVEGYCIRLYNAPDSTAQRAPEATMALKKAVVPTAMWMSGMMMSCLRRRQHIRHHHAARVLAPCLLRSRRLRHPAGHLWGDECHF